MLAHLDGRMVRAMERCRKGDAPPEYARFIAAVRGLGRATGAVSAGFRSPLFGACDGLVVAAVLGVAAACGLCCAAQSADSSGVVGSRSCAGWPA